MTIDASKTSPEKLAEMNDSLIIDNRYLRGRVAQLESQLNEVVLAIPGTRYMDPPDGGDVSLGEQVRRMVLDLGAKQAEIDRLMIEHCPDEMTDEQVIEWTKHQHPAQTGFVFTAPVSGYYQFNGQKPSTEILEARDERVAEACAVLAEHEEHHCFAQEIRSGEWRKYL